MDIRYTYRGPNQPVFIQGREYNPASWTQDDVKKYIKAYPKEVSGLFSAKYIEPQKESVTTTATPSTSVTTRSDKKSDVNTRKKK